MDNLITFSYLAECYSMALTAVQGNCLAVVLQLIIYLMCFWPYTFK